jgi:hypothetical protein
MSHRALWLVPALWAGALGGCARECRPQPGELCRIAGTGALGFNGDGRKAQDTDFYLVTRARRGPDGLLYVMDYNNHRLRRVNADGRVVTVVGNGTHDFAAPGALAPESPLENPVDFDFGPHGRLFLVMAHDPRVLTVDDEGKVQVVAGTGFLGDSGDGGDALLAEFSELTAIALAPDGSIFLSDGQANRVRVVRPSGVVEAVAGTGERGAVGDGGPATLAQLSTPRGLALDAAGNLYIADSLNHRVRRVAPGGTLTTVAGTGERGFDGDGGPGTQARFNRPSGLALHADGTLYIADTGNHRLRSLAPDGTVTTVAGTGEQGQEGDGGPATRAQLDGPMHLALDADQTHLLFGELQGSTAGVLRLQ